MSDLVVAIGVGSLVHTILTGSHPPARS